MRPPTLSSMLPVLLGVSLALACSKAPTPKPDLKKVTLEPAASEPPRAASAIAAQPAPPKAGCRALEVTGRVTIDGASIESNALLDGEHWVELDAGASVSLRHTVSTRELTLIGPARALPCRGGTEQVLLAAGQLSTAANVGVRPGAEVLIATPQGTVRYGDAALEVALDKQGLRVRVKQGEAWVEPEKSGKPRFKNPLRNGGEARLPARAEPPSALVVTCQAAAQAAAESARRVLTPEAPAAGKPSSLGERAAAHMRERVQARRACAVAAAAIGALPATEATERETLSASVAHADELWQSVPRTPSGQKN